MLFPIKSPTEKRIDLRKKIASGKLLRLPGSFSPLVSMMIERLEFDGIYISGAVLANDLGLPDVGLTTLSEVVQRGHIISKASNLPAMIDADTGFGDAINVARTIRELEASGVSGCHIEDQLNPKRCGHLDKKMLIDPLVMSQKIRAACSSRCDPNFLLIARTDARSVEGLEKAINRAKAYVDAGAEVIFPEALENESEFEKFRESISVPLLANMTEFGKSQLLNMTQLINLGYNMVIYPVTGFRLAMKAVEDGLTILKEDGTQESLVEKMQTRKHLYELLRYEDYNKFDQNIFNFKI